MLPEIGRQFRRSEVGKAEPIVVCRSWFRLCVHCTFSNAGSAVAVIEFRLMGIADLNIEMHRAVSMFRTDSPFFTTWRQS